MLILVGNLGVSSRPPRPSSQHNGDIFVPEGQRAGIRDKDERTRETKRTREKGKGARESGQGWFLGGNAPG